MQGGNRYSILSVDSTPNSNNEKSRSKSIPVESKLQNRLILSLIIKLLTQGKKVVFEPTYYGSDYNSMFFGRLLTLMKGNYKDCEFIYTPIFNNPSYNYSSAGFFKTEINLTYPMMFAPIEDLSIYIGNGSYEFMSRVRVGYNIEKKLDAPPVPPPSRNITPETPNNLSKPMTKTPSAKKRTNSNRTNSKNTKGGNKLIRKSTTVSTNNVNKDINSYLDGLEILYSKDSSINKSSSRSKTRRRSSKTGRRRTTTKTKRRRSSSKTN
jgi:hypothetical protein